MVNKSEKEFLQELKEAADMAISINGRVDPEWLSDLCESRIAKIEAAQQSVHSDRWYAPAKRRYPNLILHPSNQLVLPAAGEAQTVSLPRA